VRRAVGVSERGIGGCVGVLGLAKREQRVTAIEAGGDQLGRRAELGEHAARGGEAGQGFAGATSLVQRSAEIELIPAIEDAGLGLMAWAPMGRGVLSGKYRGHIPADSRAANQRLATYVEPYLEGPASSVVEAVAMAAKGLGRTALDVSLSWLLSQQGVATAVVGPRTPVQLKEILDSALAPLPPEIAQALEDVSDPG